MQDKKPFKNLRVKKVVIIGVIPSFAFQRAKYCALELHKKLPLRFPLPRLIGLLELDWNEKLVEWRRNLGREYWCLRRPVAVFFDDQFIGSDLELIKLISNGNILLENIPHKNVFFIKENFRKDYISYLKRTKHIYCYLDICVDDVYIGTLTFQLFSDIVPKTCENFKTLCLGNKGPLLSYKGSRIHRIVKEGWLQGGDIQYKTGGGGFSIFCEPFEDECFGISHDRRGILSMANCGRNSNGSQFFITLKPSEWMDTHFVAFGRALEGDKVLKALEKMETMYECPLKKIEIKSCGKLDLGDEEDVDARFKEEPMPKKKPKKIERITDQIVRMILEALTNALARKEYTSDILDDGDVPSKMNLQLFFQGFYSIPESILEQSARYIRKFRREFFRTVKPSATEIVEVLMYDLQLAVMTRMTTLDDVRETIGHDLYKKMIGRIDMSFALCQKPYVRRLVNQIVATAENIVNLITKKLLSMKRRSPNLKIFYEKMQNLVQSFVLQESFKGDRYHISDRPPWDFINKRYLERKKEKKQKKVPPHREGIPCCKKEEIEKAKELEKLLKKFPQEDVCCVGPSIVERGKIHLTDYLSTCRYELRKVPKDDEDRMPLMDLIEISRFKLRWMRKHSNREKTKERLCTERKIRKWMQEVIYTPESAWIQEIVFEKETDVYDHVEEIMYGAMTVGLLEMYYFMEQYLKMCGGKKKKIVSEVIYPDHMGSSRRSSQASLKGEEYYGEEIDGEGGEQLRGTYGRGKRGGREIKKDLEEGKEFKRECTCGHPCCECLFDPFSIPAPPPSLEFSEEEEMGEMGEYEVGDEDKDLFQRRRRPPRRRRRPLPEPCPPGTEPVDLNIILAEKLSIPPEEIDIRSFKWLKPYILEKGCDLKTEFSTQAHKWLEGERFRYKGFLSKHSLATRASLLSLSISLADIIKDENDIKKEIKNFVYDLWDLYFNEMFKEAILEHPQTEEDEDEKKGKRKKSKKEEQLEQELREQEEREREKVQEGTGKKSVAEEISDEDICKKIIKETPEFDFTKFCKRFQPQEETTNAPKTKESQKIHVTPSEVEDREISENLVEPESSPSDSETSLRDISMLKSSHIPTVSTHIRLEQTQIFEDVSKMHTIPEQEPEPEPPVVKDTQEIAPVQPRKKKIRRAIKKKKAPTVVEKVIEVSSSEESRKIPPYVLPFWVKFLTELTKQALGTMAKVSRLPRRLYLATDSGLALDEKMKEWFEFNAFNPQPTKGREIMDYIALHHRSLENLEDTARSYLKKKKYSELLNRCSRILSADSMAGEILADVVNSAITKTEEEGVIEVFVSDYISSAIASTSKESGDSLGGETRPSHTSVEGEEETE